MRIRAELGLLADGVSREDERQRAAVERAELEALLREEDLVGDAPSLDELVFALQELVAQTPSRLVGIALGDAIADLRQPNLPGTIDEYPKPSTVDGVVDVRPLI